ncbi:MAG: type I-E CRISPR-associated protein Cse1/CasA [Bifidobacteriaceae bacterium]|jgi:CRISPR system Cascade subunit CasA|nr:type I-E CRISPR-associated protein Cse1/CasA [Bifidobacteriaceae bacterium]
MSEFNLVDRPWIRVLGNDGQVDTVSLLELFRSVHVYKALSNELPTVDLAIFRLLLGVVYGTFSNQDSQGNRIVFDSPLELREHWYEIWQQGAFDSELFRDYLSQYRARFDLFSESVPFMQTVGLQRVNDPKKLTAKPYNELATVIEVVPSRVDRRYFTERVEAGVSSLSFDEAARWLVTFQAYDYAGKKSAVVGGTKDGGGTGWLGKIGAVVNLGDNLFETLMLNYVCFDELREPVRGKNYWEQPYFSSPAKRNRTPVNFIELLTWQSRRCLLFREGDRVVGILASYGDVFDKNNLQSLELMCGWHESSVKSKNDGRKPFIPNKHDPSRQMWRNLPNFLVQKEGGDRYRAQVLNWIGDLEENQKFNRNQIHIWTVGVEFGPMDANINQIVTDSLTINAALLSELSNGLIELVLEVLDTTDKIVNRYGRLLENLAQASGLKRSDKDQKFKAIFPRAKGEFYALLDQPFREWLSAMDNHRLPIDLQNQWYEQVRAILTVTVDEKLNQVSNSAIVGCDTDGKRINAALAERWFWSAVNKLIPLRQKGTYNETNP